MIDQTSNTESLTFAALCSQLHCRTAYLICRQFLQYIGYLAFANVISKHMFSSSGVALCLKFIDASQDQKLLNYLGSKNDVLQNELITKL